MRFGARPVRTDNGLASFVTQKGQNFEALVYAERAKTRITNLAMRIPIRLVVICWAFLIGQCVLRESAEDRCGEFTQVNVR